VPSSRSHPSSGLERGQTARSHLHVQCGRFATPPLLRVDFLSQLWPFSDTSKTSQGGHAVRVEPTFTFSLFKFFFTFARFSPIFYFPKMIFGASSRRFSAPKTGQITPKQPQGAPRSDRRIGFVRFSHLHAFFTFFLDFHLFHSLQSPFSNSGRFLCVCSQKNIWYSDSFIAPRQTPVGTSALQPSPRGGGPASLRCNALFSSWVGFRWLRSCIPTT